MRVADVVKFLVVNDGTAARQLGAKMTESADSAGLFTEVSQQTGSRNIRQRPHA